MHDVSLINQVAGYTDVTAVQKKHKNYTISWGNWGLQIVRASPSRSHYQSET
jgi:hypothetical protein